MKKILKKIIIFFYIYKNGKLILSKNKEKLWKEAHKRYQNLFLKKKKKKKHQYHCDQNKNLYEEEKQRKLSIWEIIM